MNPRDSINELLDAAIDAIDDGRGPDEALARSNGNREELSALLGTVAELRDDARRVPPPSQRLTDNLTIVRAAVQRARMAEREASRPAPQAAGVTWWRRRLVVATLSAPAGVVAAFVLAGVGGAAAAAVATVGPDPIIAAASQVPAAVMRVADRAPVFGGGAGGGSNNAAPTVSGAGDSAPTAPAAGPGSSATVDGPAEGTLPITVSGVLSDVRGNTFTLTTSDGRTYHVNFDAAKADVVGTPTDSASATVSGRLSGWDNVHADSVSVDGAAAPAAEPTDKPKPDKTPGPPNDGATTPTQDRTPPGQTDRTPPGQDGTPGPPADHTPPGQQGGGGGGDDDGNGNAGANGNGSAGGNGSNDNGNGGGPKKP